MGKRLINQKRGRGHPRYVTPSHRFFDPAKYKPIKQTMLGQVTDFIDDPAHSPILAEITFIDNSKQYLIAAEGLALGDKIEMGPEAKPALGSIMQIGKIPDGTTVFNLELKPGDGGKIARTTGAGVLIASHDEETNFVSVTLASKAKKIIDPKCFATIGVACGGGRLEKPFMKAGHKFYYMRARNKLYPTVRGSAMNAYDHPHGGKSMGKPTTRGRNTPPGGKVGHIAARRTGRKTRTTLDVKK